MEEKEAVFSPVLGKDEQIIEVFKPNFVREVVLKLIVSSILLLIFGGGLFVVGLLGKLGVIPFEVDEIDPITEEVIGHTSDPNAAFPFLILGGILLLLLVVNIVATIVGYKKKWFCYTNQRIIIRNGVIGADYKTLDYDLIGGISVNVNVLDKMVKPNTGTISFPSAASPVLQNNPKGLNQYAFTSIENPYDVYKRIKDYFDNHKANK